MHEDVCALMAIPLRILHRMKNILNENCRENQNTYFMLNNIFFKKSCSLRDNVEKYGGAREAANGNMAVRCMLE